MFWALVTVRDSGVAGEVVFGVRAWLIRIGMVVGVLGAEFFGD